MKVRFQNKLESLIVEGHLTLFSHCGVGGGGGATNRGKGGLGGARQNRYKKTVFEQGVRSCKGQY